MRTSRGTWPPANAMPFMVTLFCDGERPSTELPAGVDITPGTRAVSAARSPTASGGSRRYVLAMPDVAPTSGSSLRVGAGRCAWLTAAETLDPRGVRQQRVEREHRVGSGPRHSARQRRQSGGSHRHQIIAGAVGPVYGKETAGVSLGRLHSAVRRPLSANHRVGHRTPAVRDNATADDFVPRLRAKRQRSEGEKGDGKAARKQGDVGWVISR